MGAEETVAVACSAAVMGEADAPNEPRSSRRHRVRVTGLPPWIDASRLLGSGAWALESDHEGRRTATAELAGAEAASVMERLRRQGLDGVPLVVTITPPPARNVVRAAKLMAAKARRHRTPGFAKGGTRLDDEARFSLTPEALADAMAKRAPLNSVVDACCGAGGNAIAFARAGKAVTAIEVDAGRVALARHNARIYGVEGAIRFIHGDARTVLPSLQADLLFLDPPWGEAYDRIRTTLGDLPLVSELLAQAPPSRFPHLWLKAPPSFDTRTVTHAKVEALFGEAPGDHDRVKMLLLTLR